MRRGLCRIAQPEMVWGYHSPFQDKYYENVRISSTAFLYHPEKIDFDDDIFIGHYTILDGTGGLKVGTGSQLAGWNGIYTHSSHISIRILGSHYRSVPEYEKPGYVIEPVEIGEYVFVAIGSKILPGVTVGSYSLIAAQSLVSHDVPAHSIVAGNPARVIGSTRDMDREAISKLTEEEEALLDLTYLRLLGQGEPE